MGVSATHLDWTMVPYVRKSFYKHFNDGLKYIESNVLSYGISEELKDKLLGELNNSLSIDDEKYKKFRRAYAYAMDMTEKECHQAAEGLFHNLNTL